MAGKPIGTIFVELDLDPTRYLKGQQQILREASTTSLSIEKNFQILGKKSDAVYDLMRQRVENAYQGIKHSSQATANDIIRAEEAKNAKLKSLNEQQFGHHTSLIEGLKKNWIAASAAVIAAWALINKAVSYMDMGAKALQVESSFKIMADSAGISSERMIDAMKKATKETIDDSDLMQKAVKLMTLGYNPEQIERFSKVVITASQIAGTTAAEAYDNLADAIANRMPKALIRMGAVTREQMKVVNEAIKNGASEIALYELAMANLELKQKMLQGTQDQATITMQKYHAAMKEFTETIGKGLMMALPPVIAAINYLAAGVAGLVANYAAYRALVYEVMGNEEKAAKNMEFSNRAWAARAELLKKAGDLISGNAEIEGKATAEEITDAKKKVDAQMALLKAYQNQQGVATAEKARTAALMEESKSRQMQMEDLATSELERQKANVSLALAIEKGKWDGYQILEDEYIRNKAAIEAKSIEYEKEINRKARLDLASFYLERLAIINDGEAREKAARGLNASQITAITEGANKDRTKLAEEFNKKILDLDTKYYVLGKEALIQSINTASALREDSYKTEAAKLDAYISEMQSRMSRFSAISNMKVTLGIVLPEQAAKNELLMEQQINNERLRRASLDFDHAKSLSEQITALAAINKTLEEEGILNDKIRLTDDLINKVLTDIYHNASRNIAEMKGDWTGIRDAEIALLKVERDRLLVMEGLDDKTRSILLQQNLLQQKEAGNKATSNLLNQSNTMARIREQLAEINGDYSGMLITQEEMLEIEKDKLILENKLTGVYKEQVELLYKQKQEILEAERSLNVPKLMKIGISKSMVDYNKQLVNQFENLLPNSLDVFQGALEKAFDSGSFKDFFKDLAKGFEKLAMDIAFTIAKMYILKAVMSMVGLAGGIGSTSINAGQFSESWGYPMAEGGYVRKPTLALIGEKEPEYVIPESKIKNVQAVQNVQTTINVPITMPFNDRKLARDLRNDIEDVIDKRLREYSR